MNKPVSPKDRKENQRELDTIVSSFLKIRILHYISAKPVAAGMLLERLRQHGQPIDATRLTPILARLTRNGLLKTTSPPVPARTYSLTPKGHRLLKLANQHLRQLAATYLGAQNNKARVI
jgi:DNA-binding PadR family transcriptional regulator